jgi:hypothetical protein
MAEIKRHFGSLGPSLTNNYYGIKNNKSPQNNFDARKTVEGLFDK